MHIFVGKFPPFLELENERFPQPVQDEPSSLFLLWECTTTSLINQSMYQALVAMT
jgi:hypothetical protein